MALQLGEIMAQQGRSVRYLSLKGPMNGTRADVTNLGIERNYEIIFKRKKIRMLIEENDLVLILSGQIFQYLFLLSQSRKIVYRESNDPIYRHNTQPFFKRILLKSLYQIFLLCKPNLIVQNRHVYADVLRKSTKNNRVRLVPNPCFATTSSSSSARGKRTIDFLYMSRHTMEKGSDRAEYILKNSKLTGLVAGENEFFASAKNQEYVTYVGRVDDLSEYYTSAKYLLLLSRVEGFPNCVYEAIQCGARVLVSAELGWLRELSPEMALAVTVVNCENFEEMLQRVTQAVSTYTGPVALADRLVIRKKFDPCIYLEQLMNE